MVERKERDVPGVRNYKGGDSGINTGQSVGDRDGRQILMGAGGEGGHGDRWGPDFPEQLKIQTGTRQDFSKANEQDRYLNPTDSNGR